MYRKPQPEPLPFQRNLKVRLPVGHLLISTTRLMVTVHHFASPRAEPDYTIRFMLVDNPEMEQLLHPVDGWDFIGLVGFLWRKIDVLKTLDLRDERLRAEVGLRTVSIPSQKPARQEKRSNADTVGLIREFVLQHPNCTRLEISRGINRAKSPHILSQIESLVYFGTLGRTQIVRANGAVEYRYIVID